VTHGILHIYISEV